jgi:quinol-cytochrome oxidoreductase complex cytochrome b subunit
MLRTFFTSSYKKPNELRWLSGVFLLLLTVVFAFTGALLPWNQHGYWATIVGSEIAGALPFFGESLMRVIRGGAVLGQLSLTRFYVMHIVVLPAILVLLVAIHLSQLRHGMSKAITKRGKALSDKFVPFYPNRLLVHLTLGFALLALLTYFSWAEVPFEFAADPTSTDYTPVAAWYFLSLFQLLNYFPGNLEPIGSMLIPGLVVGSMLLLPFLDTSEERRPWRKPVTTGIALFYIAMIILLSLLAFISSAA